MKLKTFSLIFFLSILFISKELFIFNEEVLVALCFILFIVYFYYSFSNVITDSLDERSIIIQKELSQFFVQQRLNESLLIQYYTNHIQFFPYLKQFFSLLIQIHSSFLRSVSTQLIIFYTETIKNSLYQILKDEESFSRSLQQYFYQRIYLNHSKFYLLLSTFVTKFPSFFQKNIFSSALYSFENRK